MNEFEIMLPTETSLTVNVMSKSLYNYDFDSYSLAPLQETVSLQITQKLRSGLFSHISEFNLLNRLKESRKVEKVAKISKEAEEKIKSGEWAWGVRRESGQTYAVVADAKTKKVKAFADLEDKTVQDLGNLPELAAIQGQLANIAEQLESMNHLMERVEQGQYDDRFAEVFSARQQTIEALTIADEQFKRQLLLSAIRTNNDAVAKLMFSIRRDAQELANPKTKSKEFRRTLNLFNQSVSYLNASVQQNLIAYTAIGEKMPLLAAVNNYQGFIEQVLLKPLDSRGKSLAWKIENNSEQKGFDDLVNQIEDKLTKLIGTINENKIEVKDNERIEG